MSMRNLKITASASEKWKRETGEDTVSRLPARLVMDVCRWQTSIVTPGFAGRLIDVPYKTERFIETMNIV